MSKTLHNSDINGTKQNVPDVQVFGNGDSWQLLCKASSEKEGWMKSTKAYEIPGVGCMVQVTTQQRFKQGYYHGDKETQYTIAEAVTFVPGVKIVSDEFGGRKLAAITSYDQKLMMLKPE